MSKSRGKKTVSKSPKKKKSLSLRNWLVGSLIVLSSIVYGLYQYNLQTQGIKILQIQGTIFDYIEPEPVTINSVGSKCRVEKDEVMECTDSSGKTTTTTYKDGKTDKITTTNTIVERDPELGVVSRTVVTNTRDVTYKPATAKDPVSEYETRDGGTNTTSIQVTSYVREDKNKDGTVQENEVEANKGNTVIREMTSVGTENETTTITQKDPQGNVLRTQTFQADGENKEIAQLASTSTNNSDAGGTCHTDAFDVYAGETVIGAGDKIYRCAGGRWEPVLLDSSTNKQCTTDDTDPKCKITVKPIYMQQEEKKKGTGGGSNCYTENGAVVVGNGSVVDVNGDTGRRCTGDNKLEDVTKYNNEWLPTGEAEARRKADEATKLEEEQRADKKTDCAKQNRGVNANSTECGAVKCSNGWTLDGDGVTCRAPSNTNTSAIATAEHRCGEQNGFFDRGTGLCVSTYSQLSQTGQQTTKACKSGIQVENNRVVNIDCDNTSGNFKSYTFIPTQPGLTVEQSSKLLDPTKPWSVDNPTKTISGQCPFGSDTTKSTGSNCVPITSAPPQNPPANPNNNPVNNIIGDNSSDHTMKEGTKCLTKGSCSGGCDGGLYTEVEAKYDGQIFSSKEYYCGNKSYVAQALDSQPITNGTQTIIKDNASEQTLGVGEECSTAVLFNSKKCKEKCDGGVYAEVSGEGGIKYYCGTTAENQNKINTPVTTNSTPAANNNLTPEQNNKLNDPAKPWAANNPVLVSKESDCPDGSSVDSVYLPNTNGPTFRCTPKSPGVVPISPTDTSNSQTSIPTPVSVGLGWGIGSTAICTGGVLVAGAFSGGVLWGALPACGLIGAGSGLGAYQLNKDIQQAPTKSSLKPGEDCTNGGNAVCDSGDCRGIKDPNGGSGWFCLSKEQVIVNPNGRINGTPCSTEDKSGSSCQSGYCAKNAGLLWTDECQTDPFQ